jgi:hypothetical protein
MNNDAVILRPDYEDIRPAPAEVAEVMGYPEGKEPSFVPEMLLPLLDEAKNHVTAGGCFSIFEAVEINIPSGLIKHNSGSIRCGSRIARQVAGSDSFALFITTAGNSFDKWVKSKASDGDILAEYLCSSIGSVVADKIADRVQEGLQLFAEERGKGITNRYSPGYCSWNVREQHAIFEMLPSEKIGVTLTPSFLMNPIKSISGIIGIGTGKVAGPYMCDLCNMKNCLVKRARENK